MNADCPVTVGQLIQRIADGFSVLASSLDPRWARVCEQALDLGYRDVVGPLTYRGLQPSDVASWDFLGACVSEQAMWWAAQLGTLLADYRPEPFQKYKDNREYYASGSFALLVSGSPVAPVGTGAVGGIASGSALTAVTDTQQRISWEWMERLPAVESGSFPLGSNPYQ